MKKLLIMGFALLFGTSVFAAEMGDDGLHKAAWMRETFKDLSEDLEEATAEGKRLAVIIEQQNCMYCKKMHEEVFSDPYIYDYLMENFLSFRSTCLGTSKSPISMARLWKSATWCRSGACCLRQL